ncbi:MAG: putative toxin-antitoxin system toxin component, PIN family [Akkermansiaceae bacterium]
MLVFDTNIWVSYALSPKGIARQCVDNAIDHHDYAFSEETFRELGNVLMRPKFDPYFSQKARQETLRMIATNARWETNIIPQATECRDPKDNMFLDLLRACSADYFITGDEDLLVLNLYHGTQIVTPRWFVDEQL